MYALYNEIPCASDQNIIFMSYFRLTTYMLLRMVLNTAYRMIYPFLSIFARGLGVEISVISGLVANRAIVGAVEPFIFPFIETRGRKFGMLLGLGLFVLSMGLSRAMRHTDCEAVGLRIVCLSPRLA